LALSVEQQVLDTRAAVIDRTLRRRADLKIMWYFPQDAITICLGRLSTRSVEIKAVTVSSHARVIAYLDNSAKLPHISRKTGPAVFQVLKNPACVLNTHRNIEFRKLRIQDLGRDDVKF